MQDSQEIIFDFTKNVNINQWRTVDDIVMGGRSQGNFKLNKDGFGEFYGNVSLENNGGFSSLRFRFEKKVVINYNFVVLRIKGDAKNYQFRIKDNVYNRHSFIYNLETTGEWQTIKVPLSEMYPAFRGRKLQIPNFSSTTVEEVAFLIGNKIEQNFKLEIDFIKLQ